MHLHAKSINPIIDPFQVCHPGFSHIILKKGHQSLSFASRPLRPAQWTFTVSSTEMTNLNAKATTAKILRRSKSFYLRKINNFNTDMEFLERFKGRTNHLTKDGIISTVTDKSIPIEKQRVPVKPELNGNSKKNMSNNLKSKYTNAHESPLRPSKKEELKKLSPLTDRTSFEYISKIPQHPFLNPMNKNPGSPRKKRSLNSLSGSVNLKHISKGIIDPQSDFPIYFTPDPQDKLTRKPYYARNKSNPFLKNSTDTYEIFANKIKEIMGQKRHVSEEVNGKESKKMLKIRSSDSVDLQKSLAYLKMNYFLDRGWYPQSTSNGEPKLSGLSFVDRQERMISKYRPHLETEPHCRVGKLVSFNY